MVKAKSLVFVFLLMISFKSFADQSMRRCMLLPVSDSVGGAIGFKVFEDLEYYLKNSHWCYYRSNSDIIDILSNYKTNLHEHLKNAEVIKILGEKTRAGSLIRVHLKSDLEGMEIALDVLADNGEDFLFKERTRIAGNEIGEITQVLKNWLDQYEKRIPYDGRVIGVLGDQYTVDIGREYGVLANQTAKILRPTEKRKHPLLQEVIEYETEVIADGVIFHVVDNQSQGRVIAYQGNKKLAMNDWLVLTKNQDPEALEKVPYATVDEDKDYSFGRIGSLTLSFVAGQGSATRLNTNQNINKVGGALWGADLNLEIWATRNFWFGFDFGKTVGTYKKKEGAATSPDNSVSPGYYKVKFGYKYLPLGFFYGPQVDGYIGYARYSYSFDTSTVDSLSNMSFKGLLFGTRGTIPFMKKYKAYLELDFIFKPNFSEDVSLNGEADSRSNFNLGFGVIYDYTPVMSLTGGFDYSQNSAKFVNPERELKLKDTSFKVGAIFTF